MCEMVGGGGCAVCAREKGDGGAGVCAKKEVEF